MTDGQRFLIVNADDFGLSPGVNAGIIQAFERGIVTSASLMVRPPAAVEAAHYARAHPRLSLGLHIDLGEWVCRGGEWTRLYEVLPHWDEGTVRDEMQWQLAAFRDMTGREPTHLDSHQHVHMDQPVRAAMEEIAASLRVPLRGCSPHIRYCGDFYGQDEGGQSYPELLTVANFLTILAGLSPGITELGCHPGLDGSLDTSYCAERVAEVAVLCDGAVRTAIEEREITLCSFATLTGLTA